MRDFPANSRKAQTRSDEPIPVDRPEKIEQVTSGEAVRKRRGLGKQFKETFIGGSARDAFEYMLTEVVIPAVRDTMSDALRGGLDRLIYGDTRPKRPTPSGYANVGHVAYNRMVQPTTQTRPPAPRMLSRQARASASFNDIVIPSRNEAEEVIERMFDVLSRYGTVQVGTLYELTGIQTSHTDYKWGWTDLRGARASRQRNGGYLLDLPEPEPLD